MLEQLQNPTGLHAVDEGARLRGRCLDGGQVGQVGRSVGLRTHIRFGDHEQSGLTLGHRVALGFVAPDRAVLREPDPPLLNDLDQPLDIINALGDFLAIVLAHRRETHPGGAQQPRQNKRAQAAVDEDVGQQSLPLRTQP